MSDDDGKLSPDRADEIRAILARRLEARGDPIAYAQAVGFKPALHHRFMLDAVHGLLVEDAYDVLILLLPPGSAKSTYGNVVAASWALLRNPSADVLVACNAAELAHRFGRQTKALVAGEEWQKLSGSPISLADDSQAAGRWNTSAGGGLHAVGVGSSVLGWRADLLILDDLVASFEVAANPAQLFKIQEWIKSDALSRLKPQGKIIAIQQRMAHGDPPGFLMRHFAGTSTRVHVINLPMEAEGEDALGRAPGAILWPEWFSAKHIEAAKLDSARWQTMYQQRPIQDTGEFFDPKWIDTRLQPPEDMAISLCVDLATGQPGGDYTVVAAVGKFQLMGQSHLFVLDVFRRRVSILEAVDVVVSWALQYNAVEFIIDDDVLWKASKHTFWDRMRDRRRTVNPYPIPIGGQDKPTRAAPLRALMQAGRVHFMPGASWLPMLENEFESFPLAVGNGVDDMVDAIALAPRKLMRVAGGLGDTAPLPSFRVGSAGSGESVEVPAHFGSAYGDKIREETRISPPPPGIVTASMTDRRPNETEMEYLRRKSTGVHQRYAEEHGIVISRTGTVSITAAAFHPVKRREGRLG